VKQEELEKTETLISAIGEAAADNADRVGLKVLAGQIRQEMKGVLEAIRDVAEVTESNSFLRGFLVGVIASRWIVGSIGFPSLGDLLDHIVHALFEGEVAPDESFLLRLLVEMLSFVRRLKEVPRE